MKIKQIVVFGANVSVSLTLETSFNIDAGISNSRFSKRDFVHAHRLLACILLRHFSIYIYDIDVTRYYLNSYLSCSFFSLSLSPPSFQFQLIFVYTRTHFDRVYIKF